jgi:hypothetical protein
LLEGQQLHLAHIFVHAHALGERGIDFHRLARDAAALVLALDEVERAHVVQPVGQLDQSTRKSSLIASRNLRRFSAARSLSVIVSILESLVTPSTSRATSGPNRRSISSTVASVSSTVSWSSAVMMVS